MIHFSRTILSITIYAIPFSFFAIGQNRLIFMMFSAGRNISGVRGKDSSSSMTASKWGLKHRLDLLTCCSVNLSFSPEMRCFKEP